MTQARTGARDLGGMGPRSRPVQKRAEHATPPTCDSPTEPSASSEGH